MLIERLTVTPSLSCFYLVNKG